MERVKLGSSVLPAQSVDALQALLCVPVAGVESEFCGNLWVNLSQDGFAAAVLPISFHCMHVSTHRALPCHVTQHTRLWRDFLHAQCKAGCVFAVCLLPMYCVASCNTRFIPLAEYSYKTCAFAPPSSVHFKWAPWPHHSTKTLCLVSSTVQD